MLSIQLAYYTHIQSRASKQGPGCLFLGWVFPHCLSIRTSPLLGVYTETITQAEPCRDSVPKGLQVVPSRWAQPSSTTSLSEICSELTLLLLKAEQQFSMMHGLAFPHTDSMVPILKKHTNYNILTSIFIMLVLFIKV